MIVKKQVYKKIYSPKPGTAAHKVLALLFHGQMDERSLYAKTRTAGQSTNLWHAKVLDPLCGGNWVEVNASLYGMTPIGLTMLETLEEVKPQLGGSDPQKATKMRRYLEDEDPWTGVSMLPVRPGSMDFLDCPTRVGNKLIYRPDAKNAE